ncbi:MAG: PQQ-dependent sugar dehydrogenase [Spirochaetaceae bacterium]|nr:PQQ-dependent sugar dehydrogenase [Spirochaetaceae bacterium]
MRAVAFTALLAALVAPAAVAEPAVVAERVESEQATFRVVRVATGLANPWSIAFLPDGGALVSERPGALLRLDVETGAVRNLDGVPRVAAVGQGGLLDVELHPRFADNRLVYLSYAAGRSGSYATSIARGRLTDSGLEDVEVLFTMNRPSGARLHFGSRLSFGADGMLYATFGERGDRHRAQDPADHAGTIIRLRDDGSVPDDNPFVSGGGAPEVYSFGHRNPQGMAAPPVTGRVWSHEHGPQGGDEINVIEAGVNYGWPVITYGREYRSGAPIGTGTAAPGMAQPVLHWTPSIAPSGMTFYDGDRFPGWRGDLFAGALAGQHLRRVQLDGERAVAEEVLLQRRVGRVRDVKQGPDGMLWLLEDARNASIYRLEPVP